MSKFKNGEKVYVSNTSERHALETKTKRVFVGMDDGFFVCTYHSEISYYRWKCIAKIPVKKTIPWTKETCPALPFVIKNKVGKWEAVVDFVDAYCVRCAGNRYTFEEFLRLCDYLPEPKNKESVLPCGEEINE